MQSFLGWITDWVSAFHFSSWLITIEWILILFIQIYLFTIIGRKTKKNTWDWNFRQKNTAKVLKFLLLENNHSTFDTTKRDNFDIESPLVKYGRSFKSNLDGPTNQIWPVFLVNSQVSFRDKIFKYWDVDLFSQAVHFQGRPFSGPFTFKGPHFESAHSFWPDKTSRKWSL